MRTLKMTAMTVLIILIGLLLIHWLTGGQQEIVDRTYEPKESAMPGNPPLPDTVAGFQAAFDDLDLYDWGGGDGALTTVLEDGRLVWFFGDTLTKRGGIVWMPRNTSIVQTGRKMHAVNDGVQVIPTTEHYVYWPLKVKETRRNHITVWTEKIKLTGTGVFSFKRVRPSMARQARLKVLANGDMKFLGWGEWVPQPFDKYSAPPDGEGARIIGPGHWGYARMVHYDLPLANGKYLVTECQNWDDGQTRSTREYRPMLSAE